MKILMINVVCGSGSTGRICTDFATELEKEGHEVRIAYGRGKVPDQFKKYAFRIDTTREILAHGLKARLWDGDGFGSKTATEKFIKWIQEYDPDIIHLHNLHGYYVNIELLFGFLKIYKKKIVWTLHDLWAFTGHSPICDLVSGKRWETGCYKCPLKNSYPKTYVDRSKSNWIKKKKLITAVREIEVITPSNWLACFVKKSYMGKFNVNVIHNGIDIQEFRPLKNDFREVYELKDKFVVLGVANVWNDMKGFPDFVKLAELLDDKYAIVLVGVTEKQKHHLPKNIIGIGKTESIKELAGIYSSADVFLNLTYCDNYPTVNLEAIACGTPVITYNTGGSSESVGRGSGVTVTKGKLQEVIAEIKNLKKQSYRMNNLTGERREEFSKETALKNYCLLYRSCEEKQIV